MTANITVVKPSRLRRLAATVALAALIAALVYLAISAIHNWYVLLASVVTLGVTVIAAWYILSRRGLARAVAVGVAALALVAFVVVVIISESLIVLAVGLGLAAVSVAAASYALHRPAAALTIERAPNPRHPVLLMNLKSGGGKAERFGLVDLCRQRGIEPIVLHPGDDLRQLAEDSVARGADLLGMAGGDGSQALVASVASQHRIPFVVVPAGTRNHFALDLGIDRDDVRGALDAYHDGVDAVVDLAEVNGRVFVNNSSMGVYAAIVQSADYRDAKMQTVAGMLPELLGPEAMPLDLRFTLPSGEAVTTAQLLLVSNNPYDLAHLRGGGTRGRIDRGVLGIAFVRVDTATEAKKLAALEAAGRARHFPSWNEWTASEFEVRSAEPVEIGVDGEALTLQPPLRFIIRPGALTVRLPRTAPGRSPAARTVGVADKSTVIALWHTVLGRPVVNQPLKLAGERRRPDRTGMGVPESRRVRKTSLATG
jgi:diacylglycerol kinase family enzyme